MGEQMEENNKLYQISLKQNEDEILSEISENVENIQSEDNIKSKDISNKYKTQ